MENKTTNTYLATMSLFDIAYKPTEEYQGQHSMTLFLCTSYLFQKSSYIFYYLQEVAG